MHVIETLALFRFVQLGVLAGAAGKDVKRETARVATSFATNVSAPCIAGIKVFQHIHWAGRQPYYVRLVSNEVGEGHVLSPPGSSCVRNQWHVRVAGSKHRDPGAMRSSVEVDGVCGGQKLQRASIDTFLTTRFLLQLPRATAALLPQSGANLLCTRAFGFGKNNPDFEIHRILRLQSKENRGWNLHARKLFSRHRAHRNDESLPQFFARR